MNATPCVTVITPTRNRRALIAETAASLLAQTCTDWEWLVVDDGSADGTAEYLAGLMAADARIRYRGRTSPQAGACACRNEGLALAAGTYVIFLDSDDLLRPDCLAGRVAFMERNRDAGFAVFPGAVFRERPGDLGRRFTEYKRLSDLDRFLMGDCPWQTTGVLWRREAVAALQGFDVSLVCSQDVDLHIRAILGGVKYLHMDHVDYDIRWHEDMGKISMRKIFDPEFLAAEVKYFRKLGTLMAQAGGMTCRHRRLLCGCYFRTAERLLGAHGLGLAVRGWRQCRRDGHCGTVLSAAGSVMLCLLRCVSTQTRIGNRLCHEWNILTRMRDDDRPADGRGAGQGNE